MHTEIGDEACGLVVHHARARKIGPRIPVTVLQRRTHGLAFTRYSLGRLPYGHLAIAPAGAGDLTHELGRGECRIRRA